MTDLDDVVRASRGMLGIVARSLAPALDAVTVPQFRLIVLVETLGPTRSTDLAERLAVQTSTLTRNVDRLVAGGWVERLANADNRREVLVAATPTGSALVREVTERRRAELADVLDGLPDEERALLVRASAVFARAVGEPAPGDVTPFGT